MTWYVYILRCEDNSLYTGVTTDVERRFEEHKTEKVGAKYTKANKPIKVVYIEECDTRSTAQSREFALKKLKKEQKEAIVAVYLGKAV